MSHPYRDLPDEQFWSRAVTWAAPGRLDPFTADLPISPAERIATIGSCFAQHLSRHIQRLGFNYLVTEPGPESCPPDEAQLRSFGAFSARYGNVYTVRQAVQLFDRARSRLSGNATPLVIDVGVGATGRSLVPAQTMPTSPGRARRSRSTVMQRAIAS